MMWGAYLVGVLCSLFGYLYLRCKRFYLTFSLTIYCLLSVTAPAYNTSGQYTAPVILFSFFIGLVCCKNYFRCSRILILTELTGLTITSAIEAGVSTM